MRNWQRKNAQPNLNPDGGCSENSTPTELLRCFVFVLKAKNKLEKKEQKNLIKSAVVKNSNLKVPDVP